MSIDAAAPGPPLRPVMAQLGTATARNGETLTVNSQYLMLNGRPWLPVMGEFHYSRVPEKEWESEILKMKAAGIQIISTYVIWIHQEETQGHFDWSGRRNLRHFVELCAKHGMYVYPRIGPWSHAEVRNGGLPDWVIHNSPVRRNNPVYLQEVADFYNQIGQQLKGLLWKDDGPVIGIQLENEYHAHGPGAGAAHIRKLKQLALQAGLDVPLYTVTGWDGASIPRSIVLPVYGGYPDAPWIRRYGQLPPSEVFAFRLHNRAAGTMSSGGDQHQNNASSYQCTPFLTAEVGSGQQDTYFRRPVIQAQDIASIVPVMLGSGANMIGYYMFQGGRNPVGKITSLQESQRTGYPTDVPVRSYDFQAPLGEFGQERESFRRLKLVNYFLNDFGSLLAPMHVAAPAQQPAAPGDLSVPRVAARVSGSHAFLFFNNHIRGAEMPSRPGFQFRLKLPSGELRIPRRPMDLPPGAYGIWPVHLNLQGHDLIYSTAQLLLHMQWHREMTYFFFAIPGVAPEFAFPSAEHPYADPRAMHLSRIGDTDYLRCVALRRPVIIELHHRKNPVRLVIISRSEAERLWRIDGFPDALVETSDEFFSDRGTLHLLSDGSPDFHFGLLGAARPADPHALTPSAGDLFRSYSAALPRAEAGVRVTFLHGAQPLPADSTSNPRVPYAPGHHAFRYAAAWRLHVSYPKISRLSNVFLQISYTGDVARLYAGSRLLDDNFWNGTVWEVGMQPWRRIVRQQPLHLCILPAPASTHIADYGKGSAWGLHHASLLSVRAVPQYQLTVPLTGFPASSAR